MIDINGFNIIFKKTSTSGHDISNFKKFRKHKMNGTNLFIETRQPTFLGFYNLQDVLPL